MGNLKSKFESHIEEMYSQAKSEDTNRKQNIKGEDAGEGKTKSKILKLPHNELHGDHETQESEGGEADLHKHKLGCKKNPGHLNFIPVDTFSLEHLPEGLQDNDLYEWITATAVLTVRVDVKKTSPHRPKFWPGAKTPYPFYNLRGELILKTGTGLVRGVVKFTDGWSDDVHDDVYGGKHRKDCKKCWCTECKHSDHPSSDWYEFNVLTATHVVFDEIEADHTSLKLFYDRDDGTVDIRNKVSDCEIFEVNIKRDWCWLSCVTCDENIGDKLYRSWRHRADVWRKVYHKYKSSRDRHRMTFIVSHPHGCSKQVSVGQWKDWCEVGGDYKKCTYTTPTCRGSSGARVFCVGFFDGWWYFDLVHSGAHKSGLNYSGAGLVYDKL